jgi:hypothetical protein
MHSPSTCLLVALLFPGSTWQTSALKYCLPSSCVQLQLYWWTHFWIVHPENWTRLFTCHLPLLSHLRTVAKVHAPISIPSEPESTPWPCAHSFLHRALHNLPVCKEH